VFVSSTVEQYIELTFATVNRAAVGFYNTLWLSSCEVVSLAKRSAGGERAGPGESRRKEGAAMTINLLDWRVGDN
jgi:hypothetical protein